MMNPPVFNNCAGSLAWIWPFWRAKIMHGSNLALVRCCEGIEALSGKFSQPPGSILSCFTEVYMFNEVKGVCPESAP